ncbi:MAG: 1-acyl-sn-glycerol-3-phosphate acyltransferase, partial [Proteobacteria bacterium]|nr:1-acyl-sn-glycerol-3-phosphate acyltransferase [Pseudomonadota bacterium]
MRVYGRENLPKPPFILAPNHISNYDPPVVAIALKKYEIYFLAKEELFLPNKAFAYVIEKANAIRLRRGGIDLDAIRIAIEKLKKGYPVVIFPEGTRNKTDKLLLPGKAGVAFLMMKANVPIVPTLIIGTNRGLIRAILGKSELSVTFGKPVYPHVWESMKPKEAREYLA